MAVAVLSSVACGSPLEDGRGTGAQERAPRIMLTGDSITHGKTGDFTWRYRLHEHLREAGVRFDFVGPFDAPYQPNPELDLRLRGTYAALAGDAWDDEHNASWGRRLVEEVDGIGELVADHEPDLMVVALGTNDLNKAWMGGVSPARTATTMRTFIRNAREHNPELDFVLVQIANVVSLDQQGDGVAEYDSLLELVAAAEDSSESRVVLANVHDAFDYRRDTYDGTHPSARGDFVIAKSVADTFSRELGYGPAFGPLALPPPPEAPRDLTLSERSITPDGSFTAHWESDAEAPRMSYRLEVHFHRAYGFGLVWSTEMLAPEDSAVYAGPRLDNLGVYHVVVVAQDEYGQTTMSELAELEVRDGPPAPVEDVRGEAD